MSLRFPWLIAVAVVVIVLAVVAYRRLEQRRSAALGALAARRTAAWRRHTPPALFLAGLAVLLVGVARPSATVRVPHIAGTVILAFDVSNSMSATDVAPTRLAAAQQAATSFVRAQPSSVDIGVVSFEQTALTARQPTDDHTQVLAAITELHTVGSTSLGGAILTSLGAIVGQDVTLPADGDPAPNLGYWPSATIVVLSDGEDTGGPDAVTAAALAATAGVRVETVGIGTVAGTTIEVEGYQVATALNEELLTEVAQESGGSYHPAANIDAINQVYKDLDFRITSKPEQLELTAATILLAVALLTAAGLLLTLWSGRIV